MNDSVESSNSTEMVAKAVSPTPPSAIAEVISFVKTLSILLALAFSFRILILEPFKIPSGSMIPTLQIGDYILVSKWDYGLHVPYVPKALAQWSSPKRGEIVVFKRPDDPSTPEVDDSTINVIKRVVAIAGDTVEVRNKEVFLNGELVTPEGFTPKWLDGGIRNFGPEVVPPDTVFLLGDNRDRSKDSRFWEPSPFLPTSMVLGKARMIFWRFDNFGRIGTLLR
jgi:signal peptidase I